MSTNTNTNAFHAVAAVMWLLALTNAGYADLIRGDLEITDIYTALDSWLEDVPSANVIDFVGFPDGTQIDDEFVDQGLEFTDGFYTVVDASGANNDTWVDGFGLDGNGDTIIVLFDEPLHFVGATFPGILRYELYLDGELVGWTQDQGGGGGGFFAGLIVDDPFDEVRVVRIGQVFIDNLYFSFEPIPAPGAVALLTIAALTQRRKRRPW